MLHAIRASLRLTARVASNLNEDHNSYETGSKAMIRHVESEHENE